MTREQLLEALRLCADIADIEIDIEIAHGRADDALLDFIDDEEIRAAYEKVKKWYA